MYIVKIIKNIGASLIKFINQIIKTTAFIYLNKYKLHFFGTKYIVKSNGQMFVRRPEFSVFKYTIRKAWLIHNIGVVICLALWPPCHNIPVAWKNNNCYYYYNIHVKY